MKRKLLLIVILGSMVLFCSGITYSIFHSAANMYNSNQGIAKFIFNTENLDTLEFPLIDIKPDDQKEYSFAVTNSVSNNKSDVTIEYQMFIKTYHFVPLIIELYKVTGSNEELILNCDETFTRNEENQLVCGTPLQNMSYQNDYLDNYKLKVKFDNDYTDIKYSNLVDFIDIEIKSWQKIKG